jgi:hypothetical protein
MKGILAFLYTNRREKVVVNLGKPKLGRGSAAPRSGGGL